MIDTILETFRTPLGTDFAAYRNHCERVFHFCNAALPEAARDPEKLAIAAAFHDLGIWTAKTWDYLEPSVALAQAFLVANGRSEWVDEISATIERHHKLTPIGNPAWPMAEAFRRADLVDVSCGLVRFGLPASDVRAVQRNYPNAGFHLRLVQLGCAGALRAPLRPLPMLRW